MTDKYNAFALFGKGAKYGHNFFLGVTVKVACLIDKPIQAETAITRAIIPIKTFRALARAMHLKAFLMIYICKILSFCFM